MIKVKLYAFFVGFCATMFFLVSGILFLDLLADAWDREQEFDRQRYADELDLSIQMEREDERKRISEENRWAQ